MAKPIAPHGGKLVNLLVRPEAREARRAHAAGLPSLQLSDRAVNDLEMLAIGGFSPLDRFMSRRDHERVLGEMRLAQGALFSIPVTLPVDAKAPVKLDAEIALRDGRSDLLAIMRVEEIWEWDRDAVASQAFGTLDPRHPLVAEMRSWGPLNVSGALEVLALPRHYDFQDIRLSPEQTRAKLTEFDRQNVVAFQTRNPLHRVHEELTKRADVDHFTRVRTYKALAGRYYEPGRLLLALLPLAMRLAGPREALWHALIRRNYGANHFIVGRDHASPGNDSKGKPFYGPYDAQELVTRHRDELGVGVVPFHELVYLPDQDRYEEISKAPKDVRTASISGTQVREEYLNKGRRLPDWFTRPEVAEVLEESYPARHRQGVCIWFTGLSGSGKSTTADVLTVLFLEKGRQVTLLDGDVVRTNLSKGLGFSKEDRDTNIRRIGFVATEIVRHGGVAICSAVSPYRATRDECRRLVGGDHFVEVFVDTPLEVCEQRDIKGLYAQARRGEIKGFTGIDDPYEAPLSPEIKLDTVAASPEANAQRIITFLAERGFVRTVGG